MVASKKKKHVINSRLPVYLIIVMLVILVGAIIVASSWAMSIVNKNTRDMVDIQLVPYDFIVARGFGFNLDTDSLHFGEGTPGTTLTKRINLTSISDVDVELSWEGPGNLSANMIDFSIFANTTQPLEFYLTIPDNLSLGNYSGMVYLYFYEHLED
jgi:hypothetical protein